MQTPIPTKEMKTGNTNAKLASPLQPDGTPYPQLPMFEPRPMKVK